MSVVIIGGNERMERQYKDLCKAYNFKAKIFTKKSGKMSIGSPDLLIYFTDTVSHKMLQNSMNALKGQKTRITHCHSSSASALRMVLEEAAAAV